MNVFLAGATGAVGRRLSLLLLADGHAVTGTTRSRAKEAQLRSDGVTPVVADVFDSQALRDAVVRAKPEIVIHELTDLAGLLEPGRRDEVLARNARLRIEGTANLVAAATAAGARRLIAQSIAFAYAEGPRAPCRDRSACVRRKWRGRGDGARGASAGTGRAQRVRTRRPRVALRAALRPRNVVACGSVRPAGVARRCRRARGTARGHARRDRHLQHRRGRWRGSIAKARRELGFDPAFRLPTPPVN